MKIVDLIEQNPRQQVERLDPFILWYTQTSGIKSPEIRPIWVVRERMGKDCQYVGVVSEFKCYFCHTECNVTYPLSTGIHPHPLINPIRIAASLSTLCHTLIILWLPVLSDRSVLFEELAPF